jgi:hypothetical protein
VRLVNRRFPDQVGSGLLQQLLGLLDDPRLLHWYAENLDTPLNAVTQCRSAASKAIATSSTGGP